jgi:aspartate/methionine/tyrosine aminotransferase
VLVPAPSYPLLEHLARFESVETRPYRLAYDGAFHIDFDSLRRGIGPRTRAILSVNPNNPTGNFVGSDELERLASFGLPLISDEVFFDYPLEAAPGTARSLLEAPAPLVFVLAGLSKLVALPQMKLAWIAVNGAPREVTEALSRLELVADAFLSPSAPVLHAAPHWLANEAALQAPLRARLAANLGTLRDLLRDSPVSRLPVPGGWYAVLRLPDTRSDEAWTLDLLDHAGVVVQPGYFFDFEGPPHVVVSLITEEPVFTEGVHRLRDYVTQS